MRIFAFHLLNDYSGSPKVLMQLAKGWIKEGLDVTLVTCKGRDGFLSNIEGVKYRYYWYKFASNPFIRLFNLSLSQLLLIFKLLFIVKKKDVIYINTVLPFGAVFLGKIKGCRVIYHIHETTMKPPILKKFLFGLVKWGADDVIYVSNYLANQEAIENVRTHILFNAIEDSFLDIAIKNRRKDGEQTTNVLMVCSMKDYKGVFEFVELANVNPYFNFRLVLNAKQEEIDLYFSNSNISENITIYHTQTNLHPFYSWADVVLNLSKPQGWVETFGLTIIEAMAYGLPVIVPEVGGITELVEEGINGYKIDSRNIPEISRCIDKLFSDENFYATLRLNAERKIFNFKEEKQIALSVEILRLAV